MMKVWALYERTYFNRGNVLYKGWNTSCRVFENFEMAAKEMRLLLKNYATKKNAMFNGRGGMVYFDAYDCDNVFLDVRKFLKSFLTDPDFPASTKDIPRIAKDDDDHFDCYVSCSCNKNELLIHEGEDATLTECEPYIHTNAFFVDNPDKDYFFYASDLFDSEQYGLASRIYIDLKAVDIE